MNGSVAVNTSITLSWEARFTAKERNQDHSFTFKRYPQNDRSAVIQIGAIAIIQSLDPMNAFYSSPFKPRIAIVESASALSEPAVTIQDVTKQDEGFYRIEVKVEATEVAINTIFLTVFGNHAHFSCFTCLYYK